MDWYKQSDTLKWTNTRLVCWTGHQNPQKNFLRLQPQAKFTYGNYSRAFTTQYMLKSNALLHTTFGLRFAKKLRHALILDIKNVSSFTVVHIMESKWALGPKNLNAGSRLQVQKPQQLSGLLALYFCRRTCFRPKKQSTSLSVSEWFSNFFVQRPIKATHDSPTTPTCSTTRIKQV